MSAVVYISIRIQYVSMTTTMRIGNNVYTHTYVGIAYMHMHMTVLCVYTSKILTLFSLVI